jgi:serine/threonine-protein kinase
MSVEIGQVVDQKYKILRRIGEGGMGAVYEAEHVVIGRKVAVKVLHANVAEQQESVTRFEREAQAAARIGNDHILDVLDVGSLPSGARYMVCEFLEGETLAARLKQRRALEPQEVLPMALQLLNGLGAAHAAGVVHRDLKPDNIFLLRQKAGWTDFVKIIDFGISKFQAMAGDSGMRMTATGIVMGTSYYLSPEQARGTPEADHRSDLYTVGVILYELVTGQLPFSAASFNDLLFKIVLEKPKPPKVVVPAIDDAFSDLILKAMERDRDYRFQSAQEFAVALEAWAEQMGLTGPRGMLSSHPPTGSGAVPAIGTRTPSTWGGTAPPLRSPMADQGRKKRTALLAGLVGGGVLLVAAISVAVFALARSHDGSSAAAASDAAPSALSLSAEKPSAEKPPEPAPVQPPGGQALFGNPDRTDAAAASDDKSGDEAASPAVTPPPPTHQTKSFSGSSKKTTASTPKPAPTKAPASPSPTRRDLGY